jgi:hypothetical protein
MGARDMAITDVGMGTGRATREGMSTGTRVAITIMATAVSTVDRVSTVMVEADSTAAVVVSTETVADSMVAEAADPTVVGRTAGTTNSIGLI